MAFKDFPETLYCKVFDNNERVRMGSFKVNELGELRHIRPYLYLQGTSNLAGNERLRIKIYSDSGYNSELYTSDWSNISEIEGLTENFLCKFRIDFTKFNLNPNITYYPAIEIGNYSRNGNTFFIGCLYDFPFPIYDNSENLFYDHPISMEIFKLVN